VPYLAAVRQWAAQSTVILRMAGGSGAHSVLGVKPTTGGAAMPTYIIERQIPGASNLSDDDLRGITKTSNDVVKGLTCDYTWLHSYVAGDKIYCVHEADTPEDVLEHARRGEFPANLVAEVSAVFDSTGPRGLPA
jgi:hypothetical protein